MIYPTCAEAVDGIRPGTQIVMCRLCQRTQKAVTATACARCQAKRRPRKKPGEQPAQLAPPIRHGDKQIEAPPMLVRLKTWTEAVEQWEAAGRPVRPQSEIDSIYNTHCTSCSFRRREGSICLICGCRIATYGFAVFNKIKMATEHCPKGKW